jgi:hypothetical protein
MKNGIIIANAVIASDIKTVFFLPIFPISIPAGIENSANQRKTIIGRVFANELDRLKSIFT